MYGLWVVCFALVGVAFFTSHLGAGAMGCALSALAASLTVIKDNAKTRRALQALRADASLSSIR